MCAETALVHSLRGTGAAGIETASFGPAAERRNHFSVPPPWPLIVWLLTRLIRNLDNKTKCRFIN